MSNQITVKQLFNKDSVQAKFRQLLGDKAAGFGTSVLQVVNSNSLLQKADPESIYACAVMAATLDLPINNNLGFAWIVPYGGKAQFQVGWKGFVQLAMRTGKYQALNAIPVYANQFKSYNRLSEELDADFSVAGEGSPIGYAAYFRLTNGFSKVEYWCMEEVKAHAKRFSKTFNQKGGVWETNFDAMARKTVIKNMLSKWGILSIEMIDAQKADQSSIKVTEDEETGETVTEFEYVDNDSKTETKSLPKEEFTELHFEMAYNAGATIETIRNGYTTTEDIEQKYNEYESQRKGNETA